MCISDVEQKKAGGEGEGTRKVINDVSSIRNVEQCTTLHDTFSVLLPL